MKERESAKKKEKEIRHSKNTKLRKWQGMLKSKRPRRLRSGVSSQAEHSYFAGGPFYPVSTGRRDSTHISMKDWLIFHDRFLDHLKVHTTLGRLVEFIQKLLSDYKGTGQPD
ncbi:hypothetical protein CFP56_041838 [Quercus suber]|uniref:Uncharacterized protein n=1 Tax=Quercus suber TaxID=58331 RepID=A0AAW0ITU2_QUESU